MAPPSLTQRCRPVLLALLVLLLIPGPTAAALKVDITGVDGPLETLVRSALGIELQKKRDDLTEREIRRLHRLAEREISAVMQANGYYRSSLESGLVTTDKGWLARYDITPGPPLPVAEVDFRVNGEPVDPPELGGVALRGDTRLVHSDYERYKRVVLEDYLGRGYLNARWDMHRVEVDLAAYTARIMLYLHTGEAYRFGDIRITEGLLRPGLMNRLTLLKPGGDYSTRALLNAEQRLRDSGYFQQVTVRARADQASGDQVPVEVVLVPLKKNRYTAGAGFGTDTGARAVLGWERRRLNRRGHRLQVELKPSQYNSTATARYRIPLEDPLKDELALSGGFVEEDLPTHRNRTSFVSLARIHSEGKWQTTKSLNYHRESYTVASQSDVTNLLYPSIGWFRLDSDDRINPRRGSRLQLELRGAAEGVLSDLDFLQAHAQYKVIFPLGKRQRLIMRAEAGSTKVDRVDLLPASLRFFAGGDHSVRGYGYNRLGPVDANGEVIGGRHLLAGSAEYEVSLNERWAVAVFYDAGNAVNDYADFEDNLKHGAGIGLRWRTPIGPLRLDLASALSEEGNPLRIHFSMGPEL